MSNSEKSTELQDIALEEIRQRFEEEANRRRAIESKIGTVLTVNAIIISVVSIFSELTLFPYVSMLLALTSVIVGLFGLSVRDYHNPGKEIEDYLQYIDSPPDRLKRELVKSYLTAITGNEEADDPEKYFKGNRTKNDEKIEKLDLGLKLTVGALVVLLLQPVEFYIISVFEWLV